MTDASTLLQLSSLVAHVAGPFLTPDQRADASTLPTETGPEPKLETAPGIPGVRRIGLQQAATELRSLLTEALERVVENRPVGITLSSGMDSGSVIGAASLAGAEVVAFTWSVPSVPSADETRWARLTAETLGIPLVEVDVRPDALLPDSGIATRRESPVFSMFEGAWARTGRELTAHGRQHLATGYPGDLLFSGWMSPAPDLLVALQWRRLAAYLGRVAARAGGYRSPVRHEIAAPIGRQLFPGWWARRRRPVPWLHPAQAELWTELQRASIPTGRVPSLAERRNAMTSGAFHAMANEPVLTEMGVTQIHPLLDPEVVRFALSLPTWLLYEGGLDKLVLRESMRGVLPDEVVGLEKRLPGDLAVQAIRSREAPLMELTFDMRAADMEIVSEAPLRSEVEAFMRGEHTDMTFWNALTLEDWLRRWW